jgi:hypothetical protein
MRCCRLSMFADRSDRLARQGADRRPLPAPGLRLASERHSASVPPGLDLSFHPVECQQTTAVS